MPTAYTYITEPRRVISSESECRSKSYEFDPGLVPYFRCVDHEIFSTVILLLPLIQEGLCQLQAKVCGRSTD